MNNITTKQIELNSNMETNRPYDCVFSLGYRCSSAGILKSLGLKHESYPFDWMVSRLPIIEDCIATGFVHYLDPANYSCVTGVTNHYTSTNPESRIIICKEEICFNKYYEKSTASNIVKYSGLEEVGIRTNSVELCSKTFGLYLPKPVSSIRDAYGYRMMMNHHDIKKNREHQDYFARCVERWNTLPSKKTLSLYIHPVIFHEQFISIQTELLNEIRRVHSSIYAKMRNDGIYIIPVRTQYTDPTNHCCKYILEEVPDDESVTGCRICILWANCDFVDAGEIFMGVSYIETYVIKEYVMKIVENRKLSSCV